MKIVLITTVIHNTDNLIIRDVPVSSTIVELDHDGLAIIDTGMAGNRDFIDELAVLGYVPEDFSLVFNTHLHPDHIGGNRHFHKARIFISRRELAYEYSFNRLLQESDDPLAALRSMGRDADHITKQMARDLKQLAELYPAASLVGNWKQIEYYEDRPVLPDGISLLQSPGHSIDSRLVMLEGKTRRAAAVGDALYHRELWREDPNIGIHYNRQLFRKNAERIARFPDIIIPGHDRAFDNLTGKYIQEDSFCI